jgi:hypothetical protein
MNRRIALLGVFILIVGIGLIVYPLVVTGSEQVDLEVEVGVFVLPVAVMVILWGSASPDPSITTVGGIFGSAEENFLRRHERKSAPVGPARFLPHPHESVNCRNCYTAIPLGFGVCPRCGLPRTCRQCGGRLSLSGTFTRCHMCGRDEVYCVCPKVKKPASVRGARTGPRR